MENILQPIMKGSLRGSMDRGAGGAVADVTAPTITSSNAVSLAENVALSHTLTANEAVTWTKTGGADTALFTLVGSTLSMTAKDFENPVDAGTNNTYVVQVTATDAALNATNQTFTATVTDVVDNPIVANQAFNRGALTAASGGDIVPVNTGGTITSASIDSGNTGTHWQISSAGVITPSAAGAAAVLNAGPYALVCTFTNAFGSVQRTMTVTTSGTDADGNNLSAAYSYATIGQLDTIHAISTATLSGKFIIGAEDISLTGLNNGAQISNRAFSSMVTYTSHNRLRPATWDGFHIRNCPHVTIKYMRFVIAQANSTVLGILRGPATDIIIDHNYFSFATDVDPLANTYEASGYYFASGATIAGIKCIDGTGYPVDITLTNNEIYNCGQGMNLRITGNGIATNNIVDKFWLDGIEITGPAALSWLIEDNDITRPFGNSNDSFVPAPHCDGIQFSGDQPSSTADWSNIIIRTNRIVRGNARGTLQGIYLDDMSGSFGYAGTIIESNVVVGTNSHGISVRQAAGGVIVRNNTVKATPENSSTCAINIGASAGDGLLKGVNSALDNICEDVGSGDGLGGGGSLVDSGNIKMGFVRPHTTQYTTNWDGPTYDPADIAEAMTMLNMKVGGPADISGTYNAGAIGTGYTNWTTKVYTNPRAAAVLTSPSGTQTGATTADLAVTTTSNVPNGTLYTVVTTSATPPSAAQVKAGQNNGGTAAVYASSQSISSNGSKTFSATGLTGGTTYYSYFMHENGGGVQSSVSSASSFTTSSLTITALGTDADISNLATYLHPINFGTGAAGDIIEIGFLGIAAAPKTVVSVIIDPGGANIALTQRLSYISSNFAGGIYSGVANVSGTKDVQVIYSASMNRSGIAAVRKTGLASQTPVDTDTSVADPVAMVLDIPSGASCVTAYMFSAITGTPTYSFTGGLTEGSHETWGESNQQTTYGTGTFSSADVGHAIGIDASAAATVQGAFCAVWQ